MEQKWIVNVRKLGEGEGHSRCDFCEASWSTYWVEEFAMGLCDACHATLDVECSDYKG